MKELRESIENVSEVRTLERRPEAIGTSPINNYRLDNNNNDDVHLRDYLLLIRKHLWMVAGITLLITTLVAIYIARKPDIYQAQARVRVDLENNQSLGTTKANSIIVNSPINDPTYFNTQLQILTGPGLLRRVVKTLDIEHNQSFHKPQSKGNHSTWQNLLRMVGISKKENNQDDISHNETLLPSSVAPATSREDLVEAKRLSGYVDAIQSSLKVEPVRENRLVIKDTRLIDISFNHSDPMIAAKVVNTVADTFVLSNLERKTETTNTTGDFLQKRIAELQAQIRNGEERLINYARSNQILSLDESQNTVVDRLTGLNKQLLEAENDRKLAEAAYKSASVPTAASAMAEADAKNISEVESKLYELRQKRAQLLVENTEEWPEVKEINQAIDSLEHQLQDIRNRASNVLLTNLNTRYQQALAREQSLRNAFNAQRGETLKQNEAAVNYRIIQQEIQTNKGLLDGLLQRSKENDVLLAGTPNNISVVDYALAPEQPIGPRRLRTVILAFFLSLAFGVGLALFIEYVDDTLRSADDVEKFLHLPALAIIPTIGAISSQRLIPSKITSLQRRGDSRNGKGEKNGQPRQELLMNVDSRSPLAEAYRQLRTSVLLSTAGRAPKSLLVTSSVPSEGKTTTSVNTAISLAQTGAKVLIIDADMRRPRLHSIFDLKHNQGLSTILSSELSKADVLAMIEYHEQSGLHILNAGPIPPNPAELIGSDQMRRLLSILEPTFSHIVIDSPPIASFTDGVLISSIVDGVLLVVHGGKSSRNLVRRSQQLIYDVGGKIFGVVLNNVDIRSHNYYYYHHYYGSYYYGNYYGYKQEDSKTEQAAI
jgi:polysaccharide biosynthesis transport protein